MITLQKASLALALVGILILFITLTQEPQEKNIRDLSAKNVGEKIKISGTIINQKNYDTFYVLTLSKENYKIQITANNLNQNLTNKKVEVIGRVSLYEKTIQMKLPIAASCGVSTTNQTQIDLID